MSGHLFPAMVWSRPRCLDVTASYEGTQLVNERIWGRTFFVWPKTAVVIAFVTLMSAGGLMWLRNRQISVLSRHRRAMVAFAQKYPRARAFVPRTNVSPLIEQAAVILVLVAFASGLVGTVDFVRALRSRRFYVGETRRCQIPVDAAVLTRGEWPLLCATDLGFELNLPPGVEGSVRLGQERISLAELRKSPITKPYGAIDGACSMVVPAASHVRFVLGNLEITIEDPLDDVG